MTHLPYQLQVVMHTGDDSPDPTSNHLCLKICTVGILLRVLGATIFSIPAIGFGYDAIHLSSSLTSKTTFATVCTLCRGLNLCDLGYAMGVPPFLSVILWWLSLTKVGAEWLPTRQPNRVSLRSLSSALTQETSAYNLELGIWQTIPLKERHQRLTVEEYVCVFR